MLHGACTKLTSMNKPSRISEAAATTKRAPPRPAMPRLSVRRSLRAAHSGDGA